ncbi:MAG: S-layer homology domain-containing protein [Ruminococcaceae bacterium]|nr:S-layer homology domain-containing protein [Oscillospiraceae bacterium]
MKFKRISALLLSVVTILLTFVNAQWVVLAEENEYLTIDYGNGFPGGMTLVSGSGLKAANFNNFDTSKAQSIVDNMQIFEVEFDISRATYNDWGVFTLNRTVGYGPGIQVAPYNVSICDMSQTKNLVLTSSGYSETGGKMYIHPNREYRATWSFDTSNKNIKLDLFDGSVTGSTGWIDASVGGPYWWDNNGAYPATWSGMATTSGVGPITVKNPAWRILCKCISKENIEIYSEDVVQNNWDKVLPGNNKILLEFPVELSDSSISDKIYVTKKDSSEKIAGEVMQKDDDPKKYELSFEDLADNESYTLHIDKDLEYVENALQGRDLLFDFTIKTPALILENFKVINADMKEITTFDDVTDEVKFCMDVNNEKETTEKITIYYECFYKSGETKTGEKEFSIETGFEDLVEYEISIEDKDDLVMLSAYVYDNMTDKNLLCDKFSVSRFLEILQNSKDKTEFYNLIFGNNEVGLNELGFSVDTTETADKNKVCDLMFFSVKEDENLIQDKESAQKLFEKMYLLALLNAEKDVLISEADKYLGLEDEKFSEYINMPYITDSAKSELIDSLKGKDFSSNEEYKSELLKQVIFITVKYADGYGRIRDILTEYSSEIGIDKVSKYNSTDYKRVLGKTFETVNDLKNELDKEDTVPQKGGGGGSGGGSSVGGSVGKKTINDGPKISGDTVSMTIDIPEPIEKVYFNDMDGYEWAKEQINALAKMEVITGKADGIFAPYDNVTRHDFVIMIVRGLDMDTGELIVEDFSDVDDSSYYAPFIKIAASTGTISGMGDGRFGVGEYITRQDVAVIIDRALKLSNGNVQTFTDDIKIADYAKDSVYRCRQYGVISGYDDGSFRPNNFVTRAEAAVMIFNALEKQ